MPIKKPRRLRGRAGNIRYILRYQAFSSERHKRSIPPIRLTKINAQTLRPVPTGSHAFIFLHTDMVIGRHHASGSRKKPCAMQPNIRNTLLATARPSFPPSFFGCATAHPQPGHITASSAISFPHFSQNFIFLHSLKYVYTKQTGSTICDKRRQTPRFDTSIISVLQIKVNIFNTDNT